MNSYAVRQRAPSALITIGVHNDFTQDGAPARIPGTDEILRLQRS